MGESTSFQAFEERVECGSSEDALSSSRLHLSTPSHTESLTSALPHPVRSYLVVICRMQLHNADWCTAGATFQRKFIDRRMRVGRCTVQFGFSAKLLVVNIVLHTSSFCCDGEVAVQMASVDQRFESDPDRD